jgi:hypothetical protein
LSLLSGFDPGLREAEGLVMLDGTIGGTAVDPQPVLVATVTDGSFSYRPLGIVGSGLNLRMEIAADRVVLERLDVELLPARRFQSTGLSDVGSGKPRIHAAGSAMLGGGADVAGLGRWAAGPARPHDGDVGGQRRPAGRVAGRSRLGPRLRAGRLDLRRAR